MQNLPSLNYEIKIFFQDERNLTVKCVQNTWERVTNIPNQEILGYFYRARFLDDEINAVPINQSILITSRNVLIIVLSNRAFS